MIFCVQSLFLKPLNCLASSPSLCICCISQEAGPRHAHQAPPAHSCLSGATICLRTIAKSAVDLPRLIPVKLEVKMRDLGIKEFGKAEVG